MTGNGAVIQTLPFPAPLQNPCCGSAGRRAKRQRWRTWSSWRRRRLSWFETLAMPYRAQSQAATHARVEQLEAEALAAREAYSAELSALTAELGSTQEVRA